MLKPVRIQVKIMPHANDCIGSQKKSFFLQFFHSNEESCFKVLMVLSHVVFR